MNLRHWLFGFDDSREQVLRDWGLLALRLGVGLTMLLSHGWGKLLRLGADPIQFADPFGLGPGLTLALTVFAEVFCSAAIVLGFVTRLAAVPLAFTMLMAILVIHTDDPWQKQEFALMYLIPYVTLILAGPGRFFADSYLKRA